MAHSDIERLMNNARVSLPGATTDAMQLVLFAVMDEFFKGTNLWQEDIDFTVRGGEPAGTIYYLMPTGPCVIDKFMWCFGVPTADEVRGRPIYAAMSTPGELVLRTQPKTDEVYRATVALTVADPTQRDGYVSFPKWVLDKYRAVILDGLLGKMFSQPSKPFTNTQMAVYHLRKFKAGISDGRVECQRNNVYRSQAWRFPSFAGGSQRKGGGYFPPQ